MKKKYITPPTIRTLSINLSEKGIMQMGFGSTVSKPEDIGFGKQSEDFDNESDDSVWED